MEDNFKEFRTSVLKFLTNRLFITFSVICIMFYLLVARLFNLQIVNGAYYFSKANSSERRTIDIVAPRGGIYDRFGRPLAVNEVVFMVKIDPTIKKENNTQIMTEFVKLMKDHDEVLVEELPISKTKPYTFTFLADESKNKEKNWKKGLSLNDELSATDSFEKLRFKFSIPEEMSDRDAWDVLNIIMVVRSKSFFNEPITVASKIKDVTVAAIEERNSDFPGINIDIDYLRQYPAGETFSHPLGYTIRITDEELKKANAEKGEGFYKPSSLVGKTGLEKAFELELKGKNGLKEIEVDLSGRQVTSAGSSVIEEPVQGNKIVTTIDFNLQKKSDELIRQILKDILINKLKGTAVKEKPYKVEDVVSSMVLSNNISISQIQESNSGTYSGIVKNYIEENFTIAPEDETYKKQLSKFVSSAVKEGHIPLSTMFLIMYEQNIITLTDSQLSLLSSNRVGLLSFLIEKIENDEITPQMANLDPSSASILVTSVSDGSVLAAASYPTYDNNTFLKDADYFNKVNNDPTSPQLYRAFSSANAPGSTFKMISALAALDQGIVTDTTGIVDKGTFTEAGPPEPSCWIKVPGFHGLVDVRKALEVSCNYYFFQTTYWLGNAKEGTSQKGIDTLNEYATKFGLAAPTGIEISEATSYLSSPENKKNKVLAINKDASESEYRWSDGYTIRTAIGQADNNYTPAVMSKYIATLANGQERVSLHFLDKIENSNGDLVDQYKKNVELNLDFKQKDLDAVYEGMLRATQGKEGTARTIFEGFPMDVAGKTGTAQELGNPHASFAAFAPYDNPQIAVYVAIPKGDTLTVRAPAAVIGGQIIAEYFGLNKEPAKREEVNVIIP